MTRLKWILPLFLFFTPFACDDTSSSQEEPVGFVWHFTIDGLSQDVPPSDQKAEAEPDGGILFSVSGTLGEEEWLFTLDITGGTPIPFSTPTDESPSIATLDIASNSLNARLVVGDVIFRGTRGTVVISAYGTEIGDEISASLDVGLVGIVIEPKRVAQLQGDFSATLVNP